MLQRVSNSSSVPDLWPDFDRFLIGEQNFLALARNSIDSGDFFLTREIPSNSFLGVPIGVSLARRLIRDPERGNFYPWYLAARIFILAGIISTLGGRKPSAFHSYAHTCAKKWSCEWKVPDTFSWLFYRARLSSFSPFDVNYRTEFVYDRCSTFDARPFTFTRA